MDDKAKITRYAERLTEFMKVSKVCNYIDGCFVKNVKLNLFGENGDEDFDTSYSVVLSDSTALWFGYFEGIGIYIDIDGPNKGKNSYADDIQVLTIDQEHYNLDSTYLLGPIGLIAETPITEAGNYFSIGSLDWIIRNGNMDYLKVGSDGKCPDGKTVLTWDQQTSCK